MTLQTFQMEEEEPLHQILVTAENGAKLNSAYPEDEWGIKLEVGMKCSIELRSLLIIEVPSW